MRQAIFAVLFFALTMVVMSAPTNHTMYRRDPKCTRRGLNTKTSSSSLAADKKKPNSQGGGAHSSGAAAAASRSPVNRKHTIRELYERGPAIQLCGYNYRSDSANKCQNNPGFINGVWHAWGTFTVDSNLQCEHSLELQMSRNALVNAGFCEALDSIKELLYHITVKGLKGKKQTVDDKLSKLMFDYSDYSPKLAANAPKMLFFVDKKFNQNKEGWTSKFLAGTPSTDAKLNQEMKAYFKDSVKTVIDGVAKKTDEMAEKFIEKAKTYVTLDIGSETKRPTINWATEEDVCTLEYLKHIMETKVEKFKARKNAVETSWGKMKQLL